MSAQKQLIEIIQCRKKDPT